MWSHDSIISVWSDCLNNFRIQHKKSQKIDMLHLTAAQTLFSGIGSNVELDIALAHPWSLDIFPTSATMEGAAAARREDRKLARYEKEKHPGGLSVRVVPLVLEHFGRQGKKAETYLDDLSKKRSKDDFGKSNRAEFKDYWHQRIAIQLQHCNANVVLKKISNALSGQAKCRDS